MAKNNSSNQDYTNNSDGWDLSGGTTKRKLTVTGGDMTLTGSGANTYTFPASTDTLVGRASSDTLTNKDLSSSTNIMPTNKLAYVTITSDFSTASTSSVQVTGLTATVTVPAGNRSVKITASVAVAYNSNANANVEINIWDGTVGSGTQLNGGQFTTPATNSTGNITVTAVTTPGAGSKTYNVGMKVSAGTGHTNSQATYPSILLVELL